MDGLRWLRTQWDRAVAWSLIGMGAALVMVAGRQSRGAWTVADQLSFIQSAGLGGTLAVIAGATLLVSAGLHDEWRRLHRRLTDIQKSMQSASGRGDRDRDRLGMFGWALFGVAALVLVAGSRGSARAASDPEQVAFLISGGLGALLLALGGATVVLSTDLASVAVALRALQPGGTPGRTPARRGGRVVPGLLGLTGVAVVMLGWARAAGTDRMQTALDGLTLAVVGLATVALALGIAGARLRHAVTRELTLLRPVTTAVPRLEHRASVNGSANGFYTVHGLGRFHRPSCPALASTGGERQPVARVGTRLEPCLLCIED